MRALLDADVLISASIRPSGTPGLIIAALLARDAFELVLSPSVIGKVEAALKLPKIRKYLADPDAALLWLADLAALADLADDTGRERACAGIPSTTPSCLRRSRAGPT